MMTDIKTVHIELDQPIDNNSNTNPVSVFLSKFTGYSPKNNNSIIKTMVYFIFENIPELVDDISFHFFIEADHIFIIRSKHSDKIIKLLISMDNIGNIYVYDYPLANKDNNHRYYDESRNDIVLDNLDIYLPLFHSLSIGTLKLVYRTTDNDIKYFKYAERIMHTIANTSGMTFDEEGEMLLKLACLKSPIKTLQNTLIKWTKKPPILF